MKRCLCAIGLALSLGCATAVVRPYVGDQQAWPTASGSIVSTRYALPVFTSLPPVSYDVLAEMRISSMFYAQPEEGHLPAIVEKAKEIGADALVFVQGKIFFSTNYGPRNGTDIDSSQKAPTLTTVNTFNPESFAPEVTILAIRWVGAPPPGLPSSHKAATPASAPIAVTPAPAPVKPTEVTTPPVAIPPADAIAPAESSTNEAPKPATTSGDTTAPASSTGTQPATGN